MELVSPISEDISRLRRERPHVRPFVEPYVGLLLARDALVEALVADDDALPAPQPDLVRLTQGACLEPRDAFPLDVRALKRAFETLQPVMTAGFRDVRSDLLTVGRAAMEDKDFLETTASGLLHDRHRELARVSYGMGVGPRVLGFWGVQLLTPLAMARGRRLAPLVAGASWNRGYCPVCGSWPGMLRREDASGGTLTCSFCATRWRFTRRECPYCEAPGPSGQVYAIPGFEGERVVVCRRCNHYLAELDTDALAEHAPEVAGLALAPLELLARQHGHPAATMDWRQMVWF